MFLTLAAIAGALGVIPLLLSIVVHTSGGYRDDSGAGPKMIGSAVLFFVYAGLTWFITYFNPPSLIEPWWGLVGGLVFVYWIISTIVAGIIEEGFPIASLVPIVMIVVWAGSCTMRGSEMFNASQYAQLAGTVKTQVWTQDIQPKSPQHVRVNSAGNALYMARNAISQAGAIGSQFQIDEKHATLQKIGDKFWYIVPLDHVSWTTWRHTHKVPAYIKVSGEDTALQPELVKFEEGQELVYTPESCWNSNLERHIWSNGYASTGLMDYTPEIDESGKFWYVVTTYEYAVNGWDGKKVTGVLIVDPVTGVITPHKLGQIPAWADRVIPEAVVQQNLTYKGLYPEGDYWNTVSFLGIGARKNLTAPEASNMIFGANGELQWVTGITSTNGNDTSLVGLYYTNTHTGESVFYQAQGATDSAILAAIDKHPDVQFRHLFGVAPQIYNILGVMTAIVPMMNENHAFQGVGFVNVKNPQTMAFGQNQIEAYERYEAALGQSGHQLSPDMVKQVTRVTGVVDRFFPEAQNGLTMFYLHLAGTPHLFSGTSSLSPKLRMVHEGDKVQIGYVITGTDVEPLREFDNLSLPLESTTNQKEVRAAGKVNMEGANAKESAATIRERLKKLTDDELIKKFEKK